MRRSVALALLLSSAGCGAHRPAVRVVAEGTVQEGKATFYGRRLHGHLTASGEHFNMYALTAAHRSWPFGTLVLVTNLRNGRQVQVRINDRGPFGWGRIIDLSYAAAQRLDMIRAGIVPVRIQALGRAY